MISVTDASRRHAEIAQHMREPSPSPWRAQMFDQVRMGLCGVFTALTTEAMSASAEGYEFGAGLLQLIAETVAPELAGCRTYLIDASLGHSIPAVLDQLDPAAPRCVPPTPSGLVWLSTPVEYDTPSGHRQRIDGMSWSLLDIGDTEANPDPARIYIVSCWVYDDGRGDAMWESLMAEYERRHGERRPNCMGRFRVSSTTALPEFSANGHVRIEVRDDILDDLQSVGFDLVNCDGPGASALTSAVWGTLTGELAALDAGGAREVAAADVEPNRAAVKRARRQGRTPQVRTVSMGARLSTVERPATAPENVGTGRPLEVQAYTPGYWRRPWGTPPGTPRTKWVEGFWRGDPDAPVSEHSAVYVARAPRPEWTENVS